MLLSYDSGEEEDEDTIFDVGAPRAEWFNQPSNQTDAPRKAFMDSGEAGPMLDTGNFLENLWGGKQGKLTDIGEQYDVPQVKPVLSYIVLGLNLMVYSYGILIALTQGGDASNEYFLSLAKVNENVMNGEYWRLITCNFMHAGFLHLGLNLYALYCIAPEAEAVLGYWSFAAVYLGSGLAGSVLCFLLTNSVTVGASGAVFGLIGALAGYLWKNRKLQRSTEQLTYIAGIVLINLAIGLSEDTPIDNTGHIGGLVAGLMLGFGMSPSFVVVREPQIPDGAVVVPEDYEEKDRVIDQNTPLARWSTFLAFAASQGILFATAVADRTGEFEDVLGL